jgi:hypothetical protein
MEKKLWCFVDVVVGLRILMGKASQVYNESDKVFFCKRANKII